MLTSSVPSQLHVDGFWAGRHLDHLGAPEGTCGHLWLRARSTLLFSSIGLLMKEGYWQIMQQMLQMPSILDKICILTRFFFDDVN